MGKVVGWLCKISFLEKIAFIGTYIKQFKNENAKTLSAFLGALSAIYGNMESERAINKNGIDLIGNTPLTKRTIQTTIDFLEKVSTSLPKAGFPNLVNTCYANASLKFIILSVGRVCLINHLTDLREKITKDMTKEEKQAKSDYVEAINNFIKIIESTYTDPMVEKQALRDFFVSLQKLGEFNRKDEEGKYLFTIIGEQNDAQEFEAKLSSVFHLDKLFTHSAKLTERFIYGEEQRLASTEPVLAYSHDVTVPVEKTGLSLQEIVDLTHKKAKVEIALGANDADKVLATKMTEWSVPDLSKFERFNLHINALDFDLLAGMPRKVELRKAIFTQTVKLPVYDEFTKQTYLVALEPREVIIQRGSANSGHYYMYTRQENGKWLKHDDDKVTAAEIRQGEQAKFISFQVVGKEVVKAKDDISF